MAIGKLGFPWLSPEQRALLPAPGSEQDLSSREGPVSGPSPRMWWPLWPGPAQRWQGANADVSPGEDTVESDDDAARFLLRGMVWSDHR